MKCGLSSYIFLEFIFKYLRAIIEEVICRYLKAEAWVQSQWWKKRHRHRFLPEYFGFYPVYIIPPFSRTYLYLYITLTRGPNRRSLKTFQIKNVISEIGKQYIERNFTFCFYALVVLARGSRIVWVISYYNFEVISKFKDMNSGFGVTYYLPLAVYKVVAGEEDTGVTEKY
jgi:hypothetical protein